MQALSIRRQIDAFGKTTEGWLAEAVAAVRWLLRDAGQTPDVCGFAGENCGSGESSLGANQRPRRAQKKRVRSERAELLQPVDGGFRS